LKSSFPLTLSKILCQSYKTQNDIKLHENLQKDWTFSDKKTVMYVKNSLFYQCKLTEKQSGCFIGLIPVPSNLMNEWPIKEKINKNLIHETKYKI